MANDVFLQKHLKTRKVHSPPTLTLSAASPEKMIITSMNLLFPRHDPDMI